MRGFLCIGGIFEIHHILERKRLVFEVAFPCRVIVREERFLVSTGVGSRETNIDDWSRQLAEPL